MMNGYDKDEAMAFIVKRINPKDHQELAGQIDSQVNAGVQ